MSGLTSRNKGKRAEREVVHLIQEVIDEVFIDDPNKPVLQRNLEQARNGGYDITGLDWLAIEVKHHETLNLNKWWIQALKQSYGQKLAVLAYKQNRKGWRVRTVVHIQGDDTAMTGDVSMEDFLRYVKSRLRAQQELEAHHEKNY